MPPPLPSPGAAPEEPCELCEPPLALDEERTLRLQHLTEVDRPALEALYATLSRGDLQRRFFSGSRPPPRFFEHWSTILAHGGFDLGAFVDSADGSTLVAEAGYARLANGDGELGIAVDPRFRGWLGPWLLDLLFRHAAARGVPHIQALVLVDNQAMMALARRRGHAVLEHPDWGTVRLTMGTSGHTPTWPAAPVDEHGEEGRPRVLIESNRSRWWGEQDLQDAGYDLAICAGSCRTRGRCPVLEGEPCPLVAGADAVIIDLPLDDPQAAELLEAERLIHPSVRVVAGYETGPDGTVRHRPPADVVAELDRLQPDDDTHDS